MFISIGNFSLAILSIRNNRNQAAFSRLRIAAPYAIAARGGGGGAAAKGENQNAFLSAV